VFHGCAGIYSIVEFEILEPASVSLPEQVRQLIILNRAPVTMYSLEEEDRRLLTSEQLIILDTLIVNNLERGLLEVLRQSPIERFRYPFYLSERRSDTAFLADLVLTRKEVDDLCAEMKADAILSLESYSMDLNEVKQYFIEEPNIVRTRYYEMSNRLLWMIYLPGSPKPFDSYTMVDTLYFTEVLNGEYQRYYTASTMISEAFRNSGRKYGRYLVPMWNRASRMLYRGREDVLKQASKLTGQGNWDSAYAIWEKATESGDSTLVAKAFHNMAIYYELEDRLDSASYLISRAMAYDSLEAVRAYSEELETRLMNSRELYKQVR
jgi:hypothetical protein